MQQHGLQATEKPWPDFWYFGKEQRLTDNEGVAKEVDEVRRSTGWLVGGPGWLAGWLAGSAIGVSSCRTKATHASSDHTPHGCGRWQLAA